MYSEDNEHSLSENGIEEINRKEAKSQKEIIQVDYTFQIQTLKMNKSEKQTFYTACLADKNYKYTGFLFFKQPQKEKELKEGDLIHIRGISIVNLAAKNKKIFLVKNFNILSHHDLLLSNPEPYENHLKKADENNHKIITNTYIITEGGQQETFPRHNGSSITPSQEYSERLYTPLSQLTTFSKNFYLYVKVIKKFTVKSFINKKTGQPGRLFNFIIADSNGFEMQCTAFNDICDKVNETIKEGEIIEMTGGYVKLGDKKHNSVKGVYCLIIDDQTNIKKIKDTDDENIFEEPEIEFDSIEKIAELPAGNLINVLAFVVKSGELVKRSTKLGEQNIRNITLGDGSGYQIGITLWTKFAEMKIEEGDILSLRNVRVGEFHGRSLSTTESTEMQVNPDILKAQELRESKNSQGSNLKKIKITSQKDDELEVKYIYDLNLMDDDFLSNIKIKATVISFNHGTKNYYPGCPDKNCKKKVIQDGDVWVCHTCSKKYDKPLYYYTLAVRVGDASGEKKVEMYGDVGKKFLDMDADEYKDLIENGDKIRLSELTRKVEFQTFYFIGKAKNQVYNSIITKRFNAFRVESINEPQEAKKIAENLNSILSKFL